LFAGFASHVILGTLWKADFLGTSADSESDADFESFDFLVEPFDDLIDVGGNEGVADSTVWGWDLVTKLVAKFDDFFFAGFGLHKGFDVLD